jgi:hypothetical protein
MRLALIGLATIAAALAADVQAATSATNYESFFQERYCSRRPSGRMNCGFKTLEQCKRVFEERAEGGGGSCIENPYWHGPREQPKTQVKNGRRNR